MNIENINKLITHLRGLDPQFFDMTKWIDHVPECGTVACIGGWACELAIEAGETEGHSAWGSLARAWLGLEKWEDKALFTPDIFGVAMWDNYNPDSPAFISLDRAVRQLEHFRDTGTIDWSTTP